MLPIGKLRLRVMKIYSQIWKMTLFTVRSISKLNTNQYYFLRKSTTKSSASWTSHGKTSASTFQRPVVSLKMLLSREAQFSSIGKSHEFLIWFWSYFSTVTPGRADQQRVWLHTWCMRRIGVSSKQWASSNRGVAWFIPTLASSDSCWTLRRRWSTTGRIPLL